METVKIEEAKKAIGISDFEQDDLLEIALTRLADFNNLHNSSTERKKNYNKTLSFLGDSLLDSVLADYLFRHQEDLETKDLDDKRQEILSRKSLTQFAIDLGLPEYCSSRNHPNRKLPEEEPRIWAEMFEAVVGVIFIDRDRDFLKLSNWLIDRFFSSYDDEIYDDEIYDDEIYDDETFISFEWEECAFDWQRD